MSNKPPLKMSDIARIAGVSESTVSRALADNPAINIETRKKIREIAKKHNYAINKQARNLRLQSSQSISVIIPVDHAPGQQVSDPFFLELLGAIADAVTEANYDLLLSRVHKNDWRQRVAGHSHADGLVIIGQSDLHEDINDFAENSSLPMVVWGAQLPDQKYITVGCDNRLGGELATKHLLSGGRKKILFLGDPETPEVSLRHKGYKNALAQAGVSYEPSLTSPCSFVSETAERVMESVISSELNFDAVFASSDVLASVVIKHLSSAGKAVPGEVSVIGFDDISVASFMSPALSTVSQSIALAGRTIVDNLFRQIRGEKTTSEVLSPSLIKRASTN